MESTIPEFYKNIDKQKLGAYFENSFRKLNFNPEVIGKHNSENFKVSMIRTFKNEYFKDGRGISISIKLDEIFDEDDEEDSTLDLSDIVSKYYKNQESILEALSENFPSVDSICFNVGVKLPNFVKIIHERLDVYSHFDRCYSPRAWTTFSCVLVFQFEN